MNVALRKRWAEATPEDKLFAQCEARVLLAHLAKSQAKREVDMSSVDIVATDMLLFHDSTLPSKKFTSNVTVLNHEAMLDKMLETIAGFREGAFTAEETFNAIVAQIFGDEVNRA